MNSKIIRGMLKDKISLLINLIGMSVAIASAITIFLFVKKEHSYDQFHRNADNIYRVELDNTTTSGVKRFVTTGPPTGQALKEELPQVKESVLLKRGDQHLVRYGDKGFYEDQLYYVTSSFFEVFDFKLLHGDRKEVLNGPNQVILSERIAQKYFGTSNNPVGEVISLDGERSLEVIGVLQTPPSTHFDIDFFVSLETYEYPDFGSATRWSWVTFYNYILLKDGATPEALETEISSMIAKHFGEERKDAIAFKLKPLKEIYLTSSPEPANEIGPTSNKLYSDIMTWSGILILIIGIVNYLNLATAQASNRAKEVGVKKCLGIRKHVLIRQFLMESFFINLMAFIIAFGLSYLLVTSHGFYFNLGTEDYLSYLSSLLIPSTVLLGFLTLSAGLYPAFLLASFNPIQILRPGLTSSKGSSGILRKLLVGLQFSITVLLIIGTLVIQRQMEYIRSKDLGFDKEQVIIVPLKNEPMRASYTLFESRLESRAEVQSVGAARLGLEGLHGSYQFVYKNNLEEAPRMAIYPVGYDFIETMEIEMLSGRSFSQERSTDTLHQFIMNRSAIRQMNWTKEEALGQQGMLTGQGGIHGKVVGVVDDFHFEPLQNGIEPLILWLAPHSPYYVYIKVETNALTTTIKDIEQDFRVVYPNYPFEYEYLTSRLENTYQSDTSFGMMVAIFSVISIIICCIGLFGLTSFYVKRKVREIGIRKVLGASVSGLFLVVNKGILKIVAIATLVAIPLGYLGVQTWLNNFAYATSIGVDTFVIALLLSMAMVLLAVTHQTLKVIRYNPAYVLKSE